MNASAPDFCAASLAAAAAGDTHIVLLDWHSVEVTDGAGATSARLRLRDAVVRFLQLLFHSSKQLRHALVLLSTSGHDEQHVPRVVQLLEVAALKHTSIASAMQALRTAQLLAKPILASFLSEYCRSLVAQLLDWATARSAVPHVYIFCSECISSAISGALIGVNARVFSAERCHLFPCTMMSSVDVHLTEVVARLLEGCVTLTLPSDASASVALTLCARPRVLTSTVEYPSALVATRRVTLDSIREDMFHGTPLVLWHARQSRRYVNELAMFESVVRTLRHCGEALLCVAAGEDWQKLFALVPPSSGSGLALLREAAHADNVLPLPKRAMGCGEIGRSGEDLDETGLQLLPSEAFRAESLRVGGLRLRGSNVNKGRRVNFGGE